MTGMPDKRGSIAVEDATVVYQRRYPGEQFVLRLRAPECAARARPGSFAHIACGEGIPMRRPLSIMSADPEKGIVEFLYKIVGDGLTALSRAGIGDSVNIIGPIGNGFDARTDRPDALLIGGGVGIPPIVFLARAMHADGVIDPLVLMGSEVPFPFELVRSADGSDDFGTARMRDLDAIGVRTALASNSGLPDCFDGHVTDLAAKWLSARQDSLARVQIYACGPEPMLEAAARIARQFDVACQLCLEEYMACAVGGCAGCAVEIATPDGPAMKRVCVDGPVFEAREVYPT